MNSSFQKAGSGALASTLQYQEPFQELKLLIMIIAVLSK